MFGYELNIKILWLFDLECGLCVHENCDPCLSPDKKLCFGILDIFGFENLEKNDFEQVRWYGLCLFMHLDTDYIFCIRLLVVFLIMHWCTGKCFPK